MENVRRKREGVYSISVKAGKRTYFFDVRDSKNGDYYLTITESKKIYDDSGNFKFEKHKIFIYKEDFMKFLEGYNDVVAFVKDSKPEYFKEIEKVVEENNTILIDDIVSEDSDET
jgi:hypothetical protein